MIFDLTASSGNPKKLPVLDPSYPANATVEGGYSATLKVAISTDGNPSDYTYQWYKNGSAISGATAATYTFSPTALGTATFYCAVTNAAGTVNSRTATITCSKLNLFDYSNRFTGITGGWTNDKQNTTGASITSNSNGSVTVKPVADGYGSSIYRTSKAIDVTNAKTLHFYGVLNEYDNGGRGGFGLYKNDKTTAYDTVVAQKAGALNTSVRTVTLDISSISGSYYPGVLVKDHPNYISITIHKMWLT